MMKKGICISTLALALFWMACGNSQGGKKTVVADTTITKKTSFNNLFLDSSILVNFLKTYPKLDSFHNQFFDFYKQRNYEYAWFDTSGLGEQAINFMNLLNSTIYELQDSSLFNKELDKTFKTFMEDSLHHLDRDGLLKAELQFTGQFFTYAAKVYKGIDVDAQELGWFIPRKKVNLTAVLDSVIQNKGKATDKYVPLNEQYRNLQAMLTTYLDIQKKYPWDSIPYPEKSIKKGDSAAIIPMIRQRLFALGDLKEQDSSKVLDSTLFKGVKSFQYRMGLATDGVIGKGFLKELNIPVNERLKQMLVNLERLRWVPARTDSVYILVNIPEYRLHVYRDSALYHSMRVIVGTSANSTVIFNGNLKYVVFSPYWNVPASIVKNEIMPGIKRNPNYIAQKNMEITGYSGSMPIVRQKPGRGNSLGLVKFLFPNSYDIYLHDTPNRELFSQSNRSFSHGCIRISEPEWMAQFLLRHDTTYTKQKIDSLEHLPKEKWVTIPKPVPVFIGYFTAWVDKDGQLNFRKDIYGHDAKMAEKLFAKQ
ncbi:L,D-transpeptidase family protein [Foetidibacter luteolus]|uniref:L,D-transpeptidase family protein n=1 Tax=Foetidibacter luteolus TaxID=2608880 RepID=UPI00129A4FB0|nr:L,D-transpeptidase family protein [Foetidibacter luteolus]